ncbi:HNH endonuclease [Streptomyces sp. S1]|uniref:HNH endonuclease n=1 Tax=Streptomyces sp. S1 TaxID=718288 RepID=UPI003D74F347
MKGRSGRPWRRLVALARQTYPPVCHICGTMIDTSLHWNDARAWTLDHVKPLVKYGELAENLANVRPAHRSCNSRKGTKEHYRDSRPKQSRVW